MKSAAVLPIAAGILGVGAIIYIYLKQRDKDKKKPNRDGSDDSAVTDVETLEFKVENSQVPLIVGRNSVNLKSLEEKTQTVIRFRECDADHQMCMIKGKVGDVKLAKQMIDAETTKPSVITDELLVPTSSCGKIEGYCGSVLQEICQKSSAKVWVDPGSRKTQGENRRVLITGTKDQVELAKKLIEEKINEPAAAAAAAAAAASPGEVVQNEERKDEFKRSPHGSLSPFGSSSSITATEIPRELLLPSPERLRNNDGRLEVFVSSCATPSRFWVQLCGPQTTELDFLVDAMTEYYNLKENQELHKIREPYLGQIVAAMFLTDNKWYRAEVISIEPNESKELVLDVYFLDYGDQQYVGKSDILELRADFLSLRFQAIECFLAHVQPTDGSEEWNRKSTEAFESLVQMGQYKKMISKVVTYKEKKSFVTQRSNQRESSPVPGVELYEENSDKNIALELVRMGHAAISDRFGDLAKSAVLIVKKEDVKEEEEKGEEKETSKEAIPEPQPQPKKEVKFKPVDEIFESKEFTPPPPPFVQPDIVPLDDAAEPSAEESNPKASEETLAPQNLPDKIEEDKSPNSVSSNNNNNNNLDPVALSNGKPKPSPPPASLFGESNSSNKPVKPKKKKQATADFLKNEQENAARGSDWNAMMDD